MICPGCNKFPALDSSAEPELDLEAEFIPANEKAGLAKPQVVVSGTARIVLLSECCGEEMKEATFDVDVTVDLPDPLPCQCDSYSVTDETGETADRYETEKVRTSKKGSIKRTPIKARYQRRFYGVSISGSVVCDCGAVKESFDWSDEIQASHMDELA